MKKSDKKPIFIDVQGKGISALKGKILQGQYQVGKCVDRGSYGKIYDCKDLESETQLVVKFSLSYQLLAKEI